VVAPFGVLLPDELVIAARSGRRQQPVALGINSISKNHIHRDSYIYEPVRRRSAIAFSRGSGSHCRCASPSSNSFSMT